MSFVFTHWSLMDFIFKDVKMDWKMSQYLEIFCKHNKILTDSVRVSRNGKTFNVDLTVEELNVQNGETFNVAAIVKLMVIGLPKPLLFTFFPNSIWIYNARNFCDLFKTDVSRYEFIYKGRPIEMMTFLSYLGVKWSDEIVLRERSPEEKRDFCFDLLKMQLDSHIIDLEPEGTAFLIKKIYDYHVVCSKDFGVEPLDRFTFVDSFEVSPVFQHVKTMKEMKTALLYAVEQITQERVKDDLAEAILKKLSHSQETNLTMPLEELMAINKCVYSVIENPQTADPRLVESCIQSIEKMLFARQPVKEAAEKPSVAEAAEKPSVAEAAHLVKEAAEKPSDSKPSVAEAAHPVKEADEKPSDLKPSGPTLSVAKEAQPVAKASQLVADLPQLVADLPQLVADLPQLVAEAPQPVADAPQLVAEAPQPVADAAQKPSVADAPQLVAEAPQPVADAAQKPSVADAAQKPSVAEAAQVEASQKPVAKDPIGSKVFRASRHDEIRLDSKPTIARRSPSSVVKASNKPPLEMMWNSSNTWGVMFSSAGNYLRLFKWDPFETRSFDFNFTKTTLLWGFWLQNKDIFLFATRHRICYLLTTTEHKPIINTPADMSNNAELVGDTLVYKTETGQTRFLKLKLKM
jgi:hypothetical protein